MENKETVPFPTGIFTVALLNDILDYAGADLALFHIPDLITAAILGSWMFSKKMKVTSPTTRYLTTLVIEFIPFIGEISPTWSIAVLLTHYKQKNGLINKAMNTAIKNK
jgi:hypothetical protein